MAELGWELVLTLSRLIRANPLAGNIWDPSSPFMALLRQLEAFYDNLPGQYALSDLNLYLLKDQHMLGAVFFLHLLYHAALCDLCRISLPGFDFPLAAAFRVAPASFITQCQQRCHFHAESISQVIRKGLPHGRTAFDDPFVADATFESTKIQIVHAATLLHDSDTTKHTADNIETNLKLLDTLRSIENGASYHVSDTASLPVRITSANMSRYGRYCHCYPLSAFDLLPKSGSDKRGMHDLFPLPNNILLTI
jgi:hypothetical protein